MIILECCTSFISSSKIILLYAYVLFLSNFKKPGDFSFPHRDKNQKAGSFNTGFLSNYCYFIAQRQ
jgi:hypothetical protein